MLELVEQLRLDAAELEHVGDLMRRHAALLAHVVDQAGHRGNLLGALVVGQGVVERREAVDDDRRGVAAGDEVLDLIHGLRNRSAETDQGTGELCVLRVHV